MTSLVGADQAAIAGAAHELASGLAVRPSTLDAGADAASHAPFSGSLFEALHAVDAKEHAAQDKMTAVDSGQSDDLVGAMLSSQEASLSFSMLMQVRNKVAGAVDDLMKLPL